MNNDRGVDLKSVFACVAENKLPICEAWMRRNIGEILLNVDDKQMPEAQDLIKQAMELDKRNGMKFHLGRDYGLYAELCKRKGDLAKAREYLERTIEIYRECGADGWMAKAEEELARIF